MEDGAESGASSGVGASGMGNSEIAELSSLPANSKRRRSFVSLAEA